MRTDCFHPQLAWSLKNYNHLKSLIVIFFSLETRERSYNNNNNNTNNNNNNNNK